MELLINFLRSIKVLNILLVELLFFLVLYALSSRYGNEDETIKSRI